ncbi:MAG TPA: DUF3857 and transglutaminase domain-containing protein [Terriglobales bacterium]
MSSRSYCSQARPRQSTRTKVSDVVLAGVWMLALCAAAFAGNEGAPAWMHAAASASLPSYDEKTDAVLIYSDTHVTVDSVDKIRTHVREAYKILRPEGRKRGQLAVIYRSPLQKVTLLHGWCIPKEGKDFEVKDKDAIDAAPPSVPGAELMSDVRAKILDIPAPDPGNVVGYEYEIEEQPLMLQEVWQFQGIEPVKEGRFTLSLPSGWEFKSAFLKYPDVKSTESGSNEWQWVVNDVDGIRHEPDMPPYYGVVGRMLITLFPPGGLTPAKGFADWNGMGEWYLNLTKGRVDASPEIKQKVQALTASQPTTLKKMQALAGFVQNDIRYVAIELGVGGYQPHAAPDVFSHRYGDCKDKATLLRSMLNEIGVESYHVVIYTMRGAVTPEMPAHSGFNHVITAIKLPDGVDDPSLVAIIQHPKLGRLLFFDPTDELTPFGQLRGPLQANYGLLVTPYGGELTELPQEASVMNGVQRTAKLMLDPDGTLHGEVKEVRVGDRASSERWQLRETTTDKDRIKPIEQLLGNSLSNFRITQASVVNFTRNDQPFGFTYSFESQNYAKNAGDMLLVRPRVLGNKAENILETKEPRKFPVEFRGPLKDTDSFEITVPPGYTVSDLPDPVDLDYGFASYHAKAEVKDNVIAYSRSFEIKELSVPVSKADELKKFYRLINADERSTAVLKSSPR